MAIKILQSLGIYLQEILRILCCRGWSGGAMVLGKLSVPGRPTIWITIGQGPTALAVVAGGGCLDIFTLLYPFFPLSPSLWETARYRLKYCLKGPLNPNQPTNQIYAVTNTRGKNEARVFTIPKFCDKCRFEKRWSGDAMVLGKLPVPGRPTIWMTVGQGPIVLAVGAGGGCLDIFILIYPFSPLSPSL